MFSRYDVEQAFVVRVQCGERQACQPNYLDRHCTYSSSSPRFSPSSFATRRRFFRLIRPVLSSSNNANALLRSVRGSRFRIFSVTREISWVSSSHAGTEVGLSFCLTVNTFQPPYSCCPCCPSSRYSLINTQQKEVLTYLQESFPIHQPIPHPIIRSQQTQYFRLLHIEAQRPHGDLQLVIIYHSILVLVKEVESFSYLLLLVFGEGTRCVRIGRSGGGRLGWVEKGRWRSTWFGLGIGVEGHDSGLLSALPGLICRRL
jgi:hypothetical protein